MPPKRLVRILKHHEKHKLKSRIEVKRDTHMIITKNMLFGRGIGHFIMKSINAYSGFNKKGAATVLGSAFYQLFQGVKMRCWFSFTSCASISIGFSNLVVSIMAAIT